MSDSQIILADGDRKSTALNSKLEQSQKREALVAQVALNIRQSIDLESICQAIVQEIRQFLKADRAVIYKFNSDMSRRIIAEAIIPPWPSCLNFLFENGCLSLSEVQWKKYQEGEIIATADIYKADFAECHVQMLEQFQIRANIVVPILLSVFPNDKGQCNDQFYNQFYDQTHDQNLWGLLIIHQCSAPRVWENSEIQLLHQLSVQIAIAIQQAQLYQDIQLLNASLEQQVQKQASELQLQYQQTQLLAEVTLKICQSLNIEEILQTTVTELQKILQVDRALICRLEADGSLFVINEARNEKLVSMLGKITENPDFDKYFPQYGLKGFSKIENIDTADISNFHANFLRVSEIKADIVVPIMQDENVWGLLIVNQCDCPRQWTDFEIGLMQQLANQAAIALTQSQLIESLQKSEETIRLAINLNKIGCWDFDIASRKIKWNKTHFDLLGLDSSMPEGTYLMWRDRVHPDDLGWVEKTVSKALEDHVDLEVEYRIIRPQGDMRWVLSKGTGIYDDSGMAIRMVGVMFDVSDRKQMEITLEKEFIRNKAFFDTSFDGICILDSKGHIIESNLSFAKMLGYTIEEITKLNIYDIDTKWTREEIAKMVPKPEKTGDPFETLHRRKDGTICNVEISASSVEWDDDLIKFCICRDITQRKLIEISLSQAKETAEAANRAKSEFLSNMSHEIRTPMNGVLGMSQLLATTHLDEEQQDFVQVILDSGDILLAVIDDILDFSKIESGNLQLEEKEFNFTDTLNAACNLLNKQAADKNINLQHQINCNIPAKVIGDSLRVRQILINLIGNAIKFTNHGQISTAIRGRFINSITDGLLYEFSFTIADTGIGIDSDRIDKLFQPFTQADASINRQFGGTGLGLAICKKLIESMHGTIWVESRGHVGGSRL